jgi:hypothetical protein
MTVDGFVALSDCSQWEQDQEASEWLPRHQNDSDIKIQNLQEEKTRRSVQIMLYRW